MAGNTGNEMKLDRQCLDTRRKGGLGFGSLRVCVRRKEKAVLQGTSLHSN